MNADQFAAVASLQQAAHFATACAERAEVAADGLAECSMAARNGAFRIGARTGHHLMLGAEERCQAEDIERLLDGGRADELRETARRHGRERLRLLYEHYRR